MKNADLWLIRLLVCFIPCSFLAFAPRENIAGCTGKCYLSNWCMSSSNQLCPLCNAAFSSTGCTSYYKQDFNPGGVVIQTMDNSGNMQTTQLADAICYRSTPCTDSGILPFNVCWSSGWGGCGVTTPYSCWPCAAAGTQYNYIVSNWQCTTCPN